MTFVPTCEIIRSTSTAPPMIALQRREDEPTYALTVDEAQRLLTNELEGPNFLERDACLGGEGCWFCLLYDTMRYVR